LVCSGFSFNNSKPMNATTRLAVAAKKTRENAAAA